MEDSKSDVKKVLPNFAHHSKCYFVAFRTLILDIFSQNGMNYKRFPFNFEVSWLFGG